VKAKFYEYASTCGLDASELAKLLIVRERHRRRLKQLRRYTPPILKPRRRKGSGTPLSTVTAHLSSVTQVTEFDAYARICGLNRSAAGAWLLETELSERWLKKAIMMP